VTLRLEAPAKVNLSLAVVGRRPDGYHLLDTEMALLELADRLLLLPGGTGLRVEAKPDEEVPVSPGENLAWRGLLAATGGEAPMACLALEKRIPAAAGLGGGSSDAAAAWRLARRWAGHGDRPDDVELDTLSRVGADVPFFAAQAGVARVQGIGERVSRLPDEDSDHVVLVHPPFRLATAAVFAELRPEEWSGEPVMRGRNDLLAAARRLRPALDDVFRLVVAAGGNAQLTGSGPTVFTVTDDPERAEHVAQRLQRAGLRVTRTRLRREPARIEAVADEADGG
jgi:4-diphosphocytidyl-2-C-methyl-D-erythritol kinase